ncbi:unnamed protein product [Peronospora belbahrii]|uniref:J domain-containing protein n=1 Tax=Peronospora belbahrii TaxID=622444 RepID=A0AAU9L533_9STRA|nr:unnamed protein product [Peronospora belbahrii]CAH0516576.1 unnamed protein product [Peronospora belbahrii]
MSCEKNRKLRAETATKRRRLDSTKVTLPQEKSMERPNVVDLTTEDKQQEENQDQASHGKHVDSLKVPVHLESDDYFQILCLSQSASDSDVKRAYRKLAVQWHPDKNRSNPRAEEIFKKISEAYEVLSDIKKRQHYEQYGKAGLQNGAPQTTEHYGFHGHTGGFSAQRARDIFESFFGGEDPFEAFFGDRRQRRGSKRFGNDPFQSMGFGGMEMGMNMRGFGQVSGMSMMNQFFKDDFARGHGSSGGMFTTSTSSSSSMFTDQNGHVIQQKTTTTTGPDGRVETITEEYRNGELIRSTSSATNSRLSDTGRMQIEGNLNTAKSSYQRLRSSTSRPKY